MELIRLEQSNVAQTARRAAKVLAAGGIVLYPTDTIYGLAVDALSPRALERLRTLKGREKKKPISVIVRDLGAAEKFAVITPSARELAARFLPGALTLVVPGTAVAPEELMLNGALGIRIPAHAFTAALAGAFGKPYTATSANKSGREPAHTVAAILEQFGRDALAIDLVIDAGALTGGKPSTVITCVGDTPYVLREGAISRGELGL